MRTLKIAVTVAVIVVSCWGRVCWGADTGTFEVYGRLNTLSGNGPPLVTYDWTFGGQTTSGSFPSDCGIYGGFSSPYLTNQASGEDAFSGNIKLTVQGEICCTPGLEVFKPGCFDAEVSYDKCSEQARPSFFQVSVYLARNSNSTPVATWSVKDSTCQSTTSDPAGGYYEMTADGQSSATASVKPQY